VIDGDSRTGNQRLENLVSGCIAARFDDAAALVCGLTSERELTRCVAIERRAEFQQLLDARGRVAGKNLDDARIGDAGACSLRIDRMQRG
jgi:hypothetical protein